MEHLTETMIDGWEHADPVAVTMEAARIEEVLYLIYAFADDSTVPSGDILADTIGERAIDWLRKHGLISGPVEGEQP